jgi:dethiobiotin synthetase
VGKTVVTCAIGWHLRRADSGDSLCRVGVCKPIATGCRRDREGLVSEDAEALAHFCDCRLPLDVVNPVRYRKPVAPAVAAAMTGVAVDFNAIRTSLARLDAECDVLLIEGIGGLLTPIDHTAPELTVLDLACAIGYPVLVVTRAGLGTLNHTAMTVRLLRAAGCRVAGLVVNQYEPDTAGREGARRDLAMATNRQWLELTTAAPVLATVPRRPARDVAADKARLDPEIIDALARCNWPKILGHAKPV